MNQLPSKSYHRPFDRPLSAIGWPDTTPRALVRDFRWALRYWRRFHLEENLRESQVSHAWRYAWREAPRKRSNDRVKYA